MPERLDYETPVGESSGGRRGFWPRGGEAVRLVVMVAVVAASVFGSGWLRDAGWPLWARVLLFAATGGVVMFGAGRLLRRRWS